MKRPELYVPLSVRFATGNTGARILGEFGPEGLCVWACLIAAWKLGNPPGTFIYVSEGDAWEKLGLIGTPPKFAFSTFVEFTGRIKQTRRTCSGRVVNVKSTRWGRWNDELATQNERERKARYRAQSDRDNGGTSGGTPTGRGSPLDLELREEIKERSEQDLRSEATPALTDITQPRPTSEVPGAQRILDQCDVIEANTVPAIEMYCSQLEQHPNILLLVEEQLLCFDSRDARKSKTALAIRLLQDAVARIYTREIA